MTTAWLLARVGQAAGFQFAGLSRWRRREQSLGVPTRRHPAQRPRPGRPRGSLLWRLPAAPAQPPALKQLLGFQGAAQPVLAGGNRGCRWVGPSASRPLPRVFHLEGLWPPHIVGQEADVREKDARRNIQRPAAGEETVHREQGSLEQPRNAGRSIWSVWPLLGTPAAGDTSMDGTVWSAGQFLAKQDFQRMRLAKDAAGAGQSLRDGPENTATSVVHFLVSFHLFQGQISEVYWTCTLHPHSTQQPS